MIHHLAIFQPYEYIRDKPVIGEVEKKAIVRRIIDQPYYLFSVMKGLRDFNLTTSSVCGSTQGIKVDQILPRNIASENYLFILSFLSFSQSLKVSENHFRLGNCRE